MELNLRLRITAVKPPPGVQYCLQRGKSELVDAKVSTGSDLSFDFVVRAQPQDGGDGVRFLGAFTQGPTASRFVYLCVGTAAGQHGSPWTRRVKISLMGMKWSQVKKAQGLTARYAATDQKGEPACATVPLLDGGWKVE